MNKKAQTQAGNVITFMVIIAVVLAVGLGSVVVGTVLKITGDGILPSLEDTTEATFGTAASKPVEILSGVNNSIPWMISTLYIVALIGVLGVAFAFRISGEKYLMVLFFTLAIVVIFASIFASNIYEGFYNDSGPVGDELKAQALMSFFLLYSPVVITIIVFVGAAIMFSGLEEVPI